MSSRLTTTSKRSRRDPVGERPLHELEVVDGREVDTHRVPVVGERLHELDVLLARRMDDELAERLGTAQPCTEHGSTRCSLGRPRRVDVRVSSRAHGHLLPSSTGTDGRGDLLDVDVGAGAGRVAPPQQLAVLDLLVQRLDRVDQRLGRRRAAGCVHVDGHDLVDALHDRVVVEHAAGRGAHAHRDDPLGLHHLVVDLTQHGCHLLADAAGDDHDVGLAWRAAEDLHAEPRDVVVGAAGGHHLDRAAREPERGRPRRARPRPLTRSSSLPVMTLWLSPPSPSVRTSLMSPTLPPPTQRPRCLLPQRRRGPRGRPGGWWTTSRAFRRHHRGVALEVAVVVQRTPVEPAAGDLVHEGQEEDHREHDDRPEPERAERADARRRTGR